MGDENEYPTLSDSPNIETYSRVNNIQMLYGVITQFMR